jgi:aldehyde dehydrogenase (NAD+)
MCILSRGAVAAPSDERMLCREVCKGNHCFCNCQSDVDRAGACGQGRANRKDIGEDSPVTTDTRFYIDGQWTDRADAPRIPVLNPYTEEAIGEIAAGSAADVDLAVAAARRAFDGFSRTSVEERIALLTRIRDLMEARAEEFAQAITAEMGAAITFSRGGQVYFGIEHVRVILDVLKTYQFQSEVHGIHVRREPIGVCALITPWNWPLYQITAKVAPALAAGCTVVLKPSELSPFTALLFAQVMHDAGTPAGVFNLVNGTGDAVGAVMSGHKDVDMVSFTGSTRAGVLVAEAAAPTVKRVVQELGGKSPNVFLPDADFASAVPKGILGAMRNVGQSCAAPTRLVVPRARLAEVEALAADAANAIVVGNPLDEACVIGPLANAPAVRQGAAADPGWHRRRRKACLRRHRSPAGPQPRVLRPAHCVLRSDHRNARGAGGNLRPCRGDPAL